MKSINLWDYDFQWVVFRSTLVRETVVRGVGVEIEETLKLIQRMVEVWHQKEK